MGRGGRGEKGGREGRYGFSKQYNTVSFRFL